MKLGIYGGTFDPPHLAHLILAEESLYQLNLDRILWLLTPESPLKPDMQISSWEQRLELLEAALEDNPKFDVSRVDIDRPGPYYAHESMKILVEFHEGDQLIYLMGGDSLGDLPKWERPDEFVKNCHQIGVMQRPGTDINLEYLEHTIPGIHSKLIWVESPLMEISGRMIRERLKIGEPVRYFLPNAVYEIIIEKDFYNSKNQGK
ncbi:MAG: nicotinate-nucleotide adenylyltransferase [Anaerolineales bacterium]